MHDTKSQKKARQIKHKSRIEARKLQRAARIEDTTVRLNPITRTNKSGETKTYLRWVVSWRDGEKTIIKYIGSKDDFTKDQALAKAKQMKTDYLKVR